MMVMDRVRPCRNCWESLVASRDWHWIPRLPNLYAGTAEGLLYHFSLMDSNQPQAPLSYLPASSVSPIAMLGLLNGDRSLVVMTEDGGVSTWG